MCEDPTLQEQASFYDFFFFFADSLSECCFQDRKGESRKAKTLYLDCSYYTRPKVGKDPHEKVRIRSQLHRFAPFVSTEFGVYGCISVCV